MVDNGLMYSVNYSYNFIVTIKGIKLISYEAGYTDTYSYIYVYVYNTNNYNSVDVIYVNGDVSIDYKAIKGFVDDIHVLSRRLIVLLKYYDTIKRYTNNNFTYYEYSADNDRKPIELNVYNSSNCVTLVSRDIIDMYIHRDYTLKSHKDYYFHRRRYYDPIDRYLGIYVEPLRGKKPYSITILYDYYMIGESEEYIRDAYIRSPDRYDDLISVLAMNPEYIEWGRFKGMWYPDTRRDDTYFSSYYRDVDFDQTGFNAVYDRSYDTLNTSINGIYIGYNTRKGKRNYTGTIYIYTMYSRLSEELTIYEAYKSYVIDIYKRKIEKYLYGSKRRKKGLIYPEANISRLTEWRISISMHKYIVNDDALDRLKIGDTLRKGDTMMNTLLNSKKWKLVHEVNQDIQLHNMYYSHMQSTPNKDSYEDLSYWYNIVNDNLVRKPIMLTIAAREYRKLELPQSIYIGYNNIISDVELMTTDIYTPMVTLATIHYSIDAMNDMCLEAAMAHIFIQKYVVGSYNRKKMVDRSNRSHVESIYPIEVKRERSVWRYYWKRKAVHRRSGKRTAYRGKIQLKQKIRAHKIRYKKETIHLQQQIRNIVSRRQHRKHKGRFKYFNWYRNRRMLKKLKSYKVIEYSYFDKWYHHYEFDSFWWFPWVQNYYRERKVHLRKDVMRWPNSKVLTYLGIEIQIRDLKDIESHKYSRSDHAVYLDSKYIHKCIHIIKYNELAYMMDMMVYNRLLERMELDMNVIEAVIAIYSRFEYYKDMIDSNMYEFIEGIKYVVELDKPDRDCIRIVMMNGEIAIQSYDVLVSALAHEYNRKQHKKNLKKLIKANMVSVDLDMHSNDVNILVVRGNTESIHSQYLLLDYMRMRRVTSMKDSYSMYQKHINLIPNRDGVYKKWKYSGG